VVDLEQQLASQETQPDSAQPVAPGAIAPTVEIIDLHHAVAAAADGVALINPAGEVIYANTAYANLCGYDRPADLIGQAWSTLHSTNRLSWLQEQASTDTRPHWQGEILTTQISSSPVWLRLSLTLLPDHSTLCIAQPAAHRQLADDTLDMQTQQYRALVQTASCVILRWDPQGHVKFLNEYGQRLFGYRAKDLLGKPLLGSLLPETEAATYTLTAMVNEICDYPDRYAYTEQENSCRDGRSVWIVWTHKPICNAQAELVEILSVGTDATQRKQAETALQASQTQLKRQAQDLENALYELQQTQTQLVQSEKMSSLGQLVAGVAHEINNPVNFIHGNINPASQYICDLMDLLELYQEHFPQGTPEIRDKIEEIDLEFLLDDLPKIISSMKVGADRIREIVHSLRTFSRLDEAELKPVDLHEGLNSTLLILRNRLKETVERPAIEVIKDYGSLPLVECHAGQMNQVFMNILANAIDALEEAAQKGACFSNNFPEFGDKAPVSTSEAISDTPPRIWIKTELLSSERVRITIVDNGPGMSETVRQRLFDPFFTTKEVGKGTGLGMSISYQIVTERHQGKLECQSSLGRGAAFVIEIPVQTSKATGQS
jgi:hypothetical protein